MNFQIDFTHIRNYSLEECVSILGGNQILLHKYVLMVTGTIRAGKKVGFLKILNQELNGRYKIGIFHAGNLEEYMEIEVPSLTYIRETIFQFEDQLSFERSTFLLVPPKQENMNPVFLRIKCLRSIIIISHDRGNGGCNRTAVLNTKPKLLTRRTQSHFVKLMQQIYTSYLRDLQGSYKKEEILEMLEKDINDYLKNFNKLII